MNRTAVEDPDLRLLPAILFAGALLLFAVRLAVPTTYMFDEVYHAYTAGQYVQGNPDAYVWNTKAPVKGVAYMWNHPPAGILLLAAGIRVFGDTSFGWRIANALFGALGIVLAYSLALALTRRRDVALLTAIFLLADGLYFAESRIGTLDIFGVVFMTAALLSFYGYLQAPARRVGTTLLRTGLFIGLGIATKWNAVYASFILGLVALGRAAVLWRQARTGGDPEARAAFHAHQRWIPLALVVLPALVYLAAYVPFFLTGHGWSQWIELQKQIFYYHAHLRSTHPYQSPWWEWPLTLRPVWFYVSYEGGRIANIYANGNTPLYWAFVPAVLCACVAWWRRDWRAGLVLAIGFFGQWLPWVMVPRIAFIYHFLPAAIFGCVAVAWVVSELMRRGVWGRVLGLSYVALVVASFAYFYPIRSAVPLTQHAFEQRIWFKRWR